MFGGLAFLRTMVFVKPAGVASRRALGSTAVAHVVSEASRAIVTRRRIVNRMAARGSAA
jgi:hypothetical protein